MGSSASKATNAPRSSGLVIDHELRLYSQILEVCILCEKTCSSKLLPSNETQQHVQRLRFGPAELAMEQYAELSSQVQRFGVQRAIQFWTNLNERERDTLRGARVIQNAQQDAEDVLARFQDEAARRAKKVLWTNWQRRKQAAKWTALIKKVAHKQEQLQCMCREVLKKQAFRDAASRRSQPGLVVEELGNGSAPNSPAGSPGVRRRGPQLEERWGAALERAARCDGGEEGLQGASRSGSERSVAASAASAVSAPGAEATFESFGERPEPGRHAEAALARQDEPVIDLRVDSGNALDGWPLGSAKVEGAANMDDGDDDDDSSEDGSLIGAFLRTTSSIGGEAFLDLEMPALPRLRIHANGGGQEDCLGELESFLAPATLDADLRDAAELDVEDPDGYCGMHLPELLQLARCGDPGAAFWLGTRLRDGAAGDTEELTQAWRWFHAAAAAGRAKACVALGDMAMAGEGTLDPDEHEAAAWYKQACEAGDLDGTVKYAACLEVGTGVQKDEVAALALFEKAAVQGHCVAQNSIGRMVLEGRGVPRDPAFAAAWFRYAASNGSADAVNNLGILCEEGIGEKQSTSAAERHYSRAAAMGHLEATMNLAFVCLETGRCQSAHKHFQAAAEAGSVSGHYCARALAAKGGAGGSQTLKGRGSLSDALAGYGALAYDALDEVVHWKWAMRGEAAARHWIAELLYERGDVDLALDMFHAAAQQQHGPSILQLGRLAEMGEAGVVQDTVAALEMYELAAATGCADAHLFAERLSETLQLEEASW